MPGPEPFCKLFYTYDSIGSYVLIPLSAMNFIYLEQGGVFVLEPQPWRSYEQNRLVSEVQFTSYYFTSTSSFDHIYDFLSSLCSKKPVTFNYFWVAQTTAKNYSRIMFRPQCFQEILLDKVWDNFVSYVLSELFYFFHLLYCWY